MNKLIDILRKNNLFTFAAKIVLIKTIFVSLMYSLDAVGLLSLVNNALATDIQLINIMNENIELITIMNENIAFTALDIIAVVATAFVHPGLTSVSLMSLLLLVKPDAITMLVPSIFHSILKIVCQIFYNVCSLNTYSCTFWIILVVAVFAIVELFSS